MKLSQVQKSILTGIILGDGYLQATGKRNARLRLEHGGAQKEYLIWKMKKFPELFQGKPNNLSRVHPQSAMTYKYWRAQSNSTPELGKWRKLFYPDGKKHIPQNLPSLLGEEGMAVWYMDDGYYEKKNRASILYLGKVSKSEAEIARETIASNFKISSRVYDKKQKGFALYFPVAETMKLHRKLAKHILPLFRYKLGESGPSS